MSKRGGACACPRVGAFFKLMTSRGQCPRGGCACECPTVGEFFKLMTSRGQCPRGGACECLHPPPLQEILYPRLVFHPSKFRPPPPTWMAGYGPAGLHLPLLAGWGGDDKLAIDKGGNLPEKVENHCPSSLEFQKGGRPLRPPPPESASDECVI